MPDNCGETYELQGCVVAGAGIEWKEWLSCDRLDDAQLLG